jgi:hypothetical protein
LDYIESVGRKTYFISRTRNSYERVCYAFITFNNEQDVSYLLAKEKPVYIKNNHVFWLKLEIKICHICQEQEHLTTNYLRIQKKKEIRRGFLNFPISITKKELTQTM